MKTAFLNDSRLRKIISYEKIFNQAAAYYFFLAITIVWPAAAMHTPTLVAYLIRIKQLICSCGLQPLFYCFGLCRMKYECQTYASALYFKLGGQLTSRNIRLGAHLLKNKYKLPFPKIVVERCLRSYVCPYCQL